MLTPAQQAVLAAAIAASADLAAAVAAHDPWAIATAYDQYANPDWYVWKTRLTLSEITNNGFAWEEVDSLTVGKARIWEWMFRDGVINPSKPNVQAGIQEVWKGTAAKLAVQAVVFGHCRRLATRAEKLFSTGTGTTASPATMSREGGVTAQDVATAMGW